MPDSHGTHLMEELNYETGDECCIKCGACTCHAPMSLDRECPVA